jgi:PAS domain S-box-containing protein
MSTPKPNDLAAENAELRARLEEAEETLRAIRSGEVDALVMDEEVYTLKGAETPYRVLVEQMYEGAATLLDDGTVLYANRRLAALLGISLEALIGTSLRRFVPPPELAVFDTRLAEGKQCSSKGEFTLQRQDGSALPVQLSFSLVCEQDTRLICVIVTDLTERKRAEETLRQAHDSLEQRVRERTEELQQQREWFRVTLTSIGDAVIATDSQARITFINPVAENLTAWSAADAVGQPVQAVFRVINEQTRQPFEDLAARVLRENRILALANHSTLVTRDGREIPIEDSAAPIRGSDGHVAGVVLVFHDVTATRHSQDALRASNRELEAFNKAMVGRELRMIELKQEINALCAQLGRPPHYPLSPETQRPKPAAPR